MNNVTRRAHTINATVIKSEFGLSLIGSVSISNQVIGPDGWYISATDAESESVKLNPLSNLQSSFTDTNGDTCIIDVHSSKDALNGMFRLLSAISPSTPSKVVSMKDGKTQSQWHLSAEQFIRINSNNRTYVVRPMLFQDSTSTGERSRKLLISIHNLWTPPTTESEDW